MLFFIYPSDTRSDPTLLHDILYEQDDRRPLFSHAFNEHSFIILHFFSRNSLIY